MLKKIKWSASVVRRASVVVMLLIAATLASGCTRNIVTRLYLHGDVVDEFNEQPISGAVVRFNDLEQATDSQGRFRRLVLVECLEPSVEVPLLTSRISEYEIQSFAASYVPVLLKFQLLKASLIGKEQCPKEADQYLRVRMVKGQGQS